MRTPEPQKALSIKQPWAWLICNGYKAIENRSWPTKKRGVFYIHAGKQFDAKGYAWVKENFPDIPMPKKEEFQFGGIVGKASIINVVEQKHKNLLCSDDRPWFNDKYGFVLHAASPVRFQALRGQLGFFNFYN